MKVNIIRSVSAEDCATKLEVKIDGETVIMANDADSEDATFDRNFNDFLFLSEILQRVYRAGKEKQSLEISETTKDW